MAKKEVVVADLSPGLTKGQMMIVMIEMTMMMIMTMMMMMTLMMMVIIIIIIIMMQVEPEASTPVCWEKASRAKITASQADRELSQVIIIIMIVMMIEKQIIIKSVFTSSLTVNYWASH